MIRKKTQQIKIITNIIKGLVLFIGGIVISLIFNDISLSVISFDHNNRELSSLKNIKLAKNKAVDFDFIAKESNLGIISIRFSKPNIRLPYEFQDSINYELIDVSSGKLIYKASFKSGLIYDEPLLPLGIPLQPDSINKMYKLRLISQKGISQNILSISETQPVISTSYKFDKRKILTGEYLLKKILNGFRNVYSALYTLSFLLPFFIFILWQLYKKYKVLLFIYVVFFSFFIFFDVFYIPDINIILQAQLAIVWIILMRINKVDSSLSYFLFFITFIISFVFLIMGKENSVTFSKIHYWSFMFFLSGIVFSVYEEVTKNSVRRLF